MSFSKRLLLLQKCCFVMFPARMQRPGIYLSPWHRPPLRTHSTASTTEQVLKPFVVGVFVDLDSVGPSDHSRVGVCEYVMSLRQFSKRMLVLGAGKDLNAFQAFGNRNTQTWVSPEEKQRRRELDQEYMKAPPLKNRNEMTADEHDFGEEDFLDMNVAQTGYDEDGVLRCGVCGAKMKLTKKDRARGLTVERKLDRHMRMLHDREQEKRKTRRKQGRKLTDKDMKKWQKYEQAQVGLARKPASRLKKKGKQQQPKNDMFRVLREQSVTCVSADDVDSTLIKAARQWMSHVIQSVKKKKIETMKLSDITQAPHQAQEHDQQKDENNKEETQCYGCLVVVSEDSDFAGLLTEAGRKGFIKVSATPASVKQTLKLCKASDIVLTQSRPISDGGNDNDNGNDNHNDTAVDEQQHASMIFGNKVRLTASAHTPVGATVLATRKALL